MYSDYDEELKPKQRGILRRREARRKWLACQFNCFYLMSRLVMFWCVILACLKYLAEDV